MSGLRGRPTPADDRPFVIATVRIVIPNGIWFGDFSREHPTVRMEVMNRGDASADLSVSDVWIAGGAGGAWTSEIAAFRDVRAVDSLADLGGGCVYRVTFRSPRIVDLYRQLGIPLVFPIRIHGGRIFWEIAAREEAFRRFYDYARGVDATATILSIRRRPLRSHLPELSDAQRTLLSTAMAEGYFAVPRSITLTDLARKIGRSKSSTSEALARIEQKILESAVRPRSGLA